MIWLDFWSFLLVIVLDVGLTDWTSWSVVIVGMRVSHFTVTSAPLLTVPVLWNMLQEIKLNKLSRRSAIRVLWVASSMSEKWVSALIPTVFY